MLFINCSLGIGWVFVVILNKTYQLFQEMAWMFWCSVLKERTHLTAGGCLRNVVTVEANGVLKAELGGPSAAWAQSRCPERGLKRECHTAWTSAFDFVICNSAVDPTVDWTNRKCPLGWRVWTLSWQMGQVPQHQADFSAAGGCFPSSAKSLEKAEDLPEKCLILLKDGFASWTGARDLIQFLIKLSECGTFISIALSNVHSSFIHDHTSSSHWMLQGVWNTTQYSLQYSVHQ